MDKQNPKSSNLPTNLSAPAQRALAGAGFTSLEQLAGVKEDEISRLHGLGPKTIRQLREAMAARGLHFKE